MKIMFLMDHAWVESMKQAMILCTPIPFSQIFANNKIGWMTAEVFVKLSSKLYAERRRLLADPESDSESGSHTSRIDPRVCIFLSAIFTFGRLELCHFSQESSECRFILLTL